MRHKLYIYFISPIHGSENIDTHTHTHVHKHINTYKQHFTRSVNFFAASVCTGPSLMPSLQQPEAQLPQRDRATRYVSIRAMFHEIQYVNYKDFQTAKVTFRVIQQHWQWCHSIGHIRFPIRLPLQLCLYLKPFARYYHFFPNM